MAFVPLQVCPTLCRSDFGNVRLAHICFFASEISFALKNILVNTYGEGK